MTKEKSTIRFWEMSQRQKTILISFFVVWIVALIWLAASYQKFEDGVLSKKYLVLVGFVFMMIPGIGVSTYKKFSTGK